ncbi:hypothetical protein CABS01_11973 [Colletotrichum abscissum]|uniref:Ubiquinol-cytochrome-c reductase cytochrome c1 n=1 Tax=Colletotrichum abscissum TaxID=1671311 RepID=A0A9P9XFG1_9PEZI|nr:uncharacterized protein CABS01_11973 [Colletotrichum abscissum]KAI3553391.1 hypothetical protein CABS02_06263 [Colletotrichum abscissum]KAK1491649.1 hypothetical protein CABS01_11973 [Colletotrichum abscissum]
MSEQQDVYRMCRALFKGKSKKLKKTRIREILIENQSALHRLFTSYGEVRLTAIIQSLLKSGAFESDSHAKALFPDIFQTTPQQDAHREASEADAAKSVADILGGMNHLEDMESPETVATTAPTSSAWGYEVPPMPVPDDESPMQDAAASETHLETNGIDETPSQVHAKIPSLYPTYLPFTTQHSILTASQRLLEECCFDFAKNRFPDVLQRKGWECASAVELTNWTKVFNAEVLTLPPQLITVTDKTINEVFAPTHKLRHTAVHRLPTTAREVIRLIRAGVELTETLQDFTRASQLEDLILEVDEKIKTMELTKNVLEDRAAAQLEDIRRQREDLDRQEREFIENMIKEDQEHKALIGSLLETAVAEILEKKNAKNQVSDEDETDGQDVYLEAGEGTNRDSESLENKDDSKDSNGLWRKLTDAWSGMTFGPNKKFLFGGF